MNLTEGNIKNQVWTLALPVTVGFFFNTMLNIVDSYFAGKISTEALAAMSLTFPIFFIILSFSQGVSTGCSAIIANAIGAKEFDKIQKFSAQTLSYGVLCSILVTCIGLLVSDPLLKFLGATHEYLTLSSSYINVIYIGSFFFLLSSSANAILLSHGNSITMRNVLIFTFVINCILDPWFLYGGYGIPPMGLKGLGLATVICVAFGAFYTLIRVIADGHLKGITAKDFIPDFETFKAMTEQSVPSAVNMMSIALGIFIVTYYVNKFGSDYTAAFGVSMRIQQIFILPTIGINVACLMLVGQNNGARNFKRIYETIKVCLKYGHLIIIAGSSILFFTPAFLLEFFIQEGEVLKEGVTYLKFAAFTNEAYMLLAIYSSVLQGIKRPNFLLVLGIARQLVLPIILFYVTIDKMGLGIQSLWVSIFFIACLSALLTMLFTKRQLKLEKERSLQPIPFTDV